MASKRFEDDLREHLRDPEFAAAYLEAVVADDAITGGVDGMLHAIREIAISREGGISGAAQEANVGRQTFYDSFKPGGNPRINTVDAVLRTVGMRLIVKPISKQQDEAVRRGARKVAAVSRRASAKKHHNPQAGNGVPGGVMVAR